MRLIVARREMLSGLMMGGILGATGVIIASILNKRKDLQRRRDEQAAFANA